MKGISLPINTIVVVAIAILVLMVMAGFFSLNVGSGINTIQLNSAISSACNVLTSTYNCDPNRLDDAKARIKLPGQSEETSVPLYDGSQTSLCVLAGVDPGNAEAVNQCLSKCGCTSFTTTTTLRQPVQPPGGGPPIGGIRPIG